MKNRLSQARLLAVVGAISSVTVLGSRGQEPTSVDERHTTNNPVVVATAPEVVPAPQTQPAASAAPTIKSGAGAAAPSAAAKLPYGVEDVVKLTRAQVGEDVVLTYIQNSGTIYNLGADDIVNLRSEGVSDKVINNMLDQRKRANETAAQPTVQTAPAQPYAYSDPALMGSAPTYTQTPYPQVAPIYVPPAPEVVEAAPSTVYVIPYPAATGAYYSQPGYYRSYPYYGSYYRGGYGCASSIVTINAGYGHRAYRPRWH